MSQKPPPEAMSDPHPWVNQLRFWDCSAGLWIGQMIPEPKIEEFGAVLSVAADAPHVDDRIKHRHIPLSAQVMNRQALLEAIDWVFLQWQGDRAVLVRAEEPSERPALVVAGVFLRMGGTYFDALTCIRRGNPLALWDFRYLNILKELHGR